MKKEDYVSLEVAKILEKKGYKEPGNATYTVSREGRYEFCRYITDDIKRRFGLPKMKDGCKYDTYLAPTLYEAQKWLRENYQLHIDIGICGDYSTDADGNKVDEWSFWTFSIYYITNINNHIFDCKGEYDSYEEALNSGILEALKII